MTNVGIFLFGTLAGIGLSMIALVVYLEVDDWQKRKKARKEFDKYLDRSKRGEYRDY